MSADLPYQPPAMQGPPELPYGLLPEPPAVKVFGILHLVFAGLGILGAIWGVIVLFAGNPFLKLAPPSPQLDAQIAMQEKLNPMTATGAVLSLLIAIPMIIAGVRLLKKRGSGLKWSNIYACSSLGAKVVNGIISMVIYVPAMQEVTNSIVGSSRMPPGLSQGLTIGLIAGALGGIAVSCIYPALTLVVLNRPAVKAWFSHRPG